MLLSEDLRPPLYFPNCAELRLRLREAALTALLSGDIAARRKRVRVLLSENLGPPLYFPNGAELRLRLRVAALIAHLMGDMVARRERARVLLSENLGPPLYLPNGAQLRLRLRVAAKQSDRTPIIKPRTQQGSAARSLVYVGELTGPTEEQPSHSVLASVEHGPSRRDQRLRLLLYARELEGGDLVLGQILELDDLARLFNLCENIVVLFRPRLRGDRAPSAVARFIQAFFIGSPKQQFRRQRGIGSGQSSAKRREPFLRER